MKQEKQTKNGNHIDYVSRMEFLKENLSNYVTDNEYDLTYDKSSNRVIINNHFFNNYDADYFKRYLKNVYFGVDGNHFFGGVILSTTNADIENAIVLLIKEGEYEE